jgi:hypothetical protein
MTCVVMGSRRGFEGMGNPGVRDKRDIEWLVSWALVDNGLGRLFSGGVLQTDWSDLGTSVQRSAWASSAPAVRHEDALLVAEAIGQLHPDCAALVVGHGRVGDRPDWVEDGVGHWEQMRNKRGQPMWDWDKPSNRSAKRSARTPRLQWVGESQKAVDFYRARYDLWWIGLHDLVDALNAVMTRHEATGPRAKDRPWLGDAPVVFGADGKPMAPHASAIRLSTQEFRRPVKPAQLPENIHRGESAGRSSHGRS